MKVLLNYQNTKGEEDFALTPFLFGVWYKGDSVKAIGIGISWGWYSFAITLCSGVPKGFPIYKSLNESNTKELQKQNIIIKNVLSNLRKQLEASKQLTQSFDNDESRWRDGMESGLETAIELLENTLDKDIEYCEKHPKEKILTHKVCPICEAFNYK